MNPIVPVALATAAVAALIAFTRKKGGPTPDPIDVAPLMMQGAAGTRQYAVRKVGPGYAWSISGDKVDQGSHAISGTAVMAMFESLYSGNNADNVTGHIAKSPSEDGLAGSFSISKQDPVRWAWIVSKPAPQQADSYGSGDSTSRGAATLAALKTVADYTDWLTGLAEPQGGADASLVRQHHGVLISGVSVSAYDLPQWLEWARPKIENAINGWTDSETATDIATQIHDLLELHDLGAGVKFTGRTHEQVLAAMVKPLQEWHESKYLELDSIQYTVAAAAIGAKLHTLGKKGRVKGHPVIAIRGTPRAKWYVWQPGNRRGIQLASISGEELTVLKAWAAASAAASGGPLPGDVAGGGQDSPTAGIPPGCDGQVKVSSFSRNLPSSTFLEMWERDVKLWTPPSPKCTRYTVKVGICMRPSGGGTFGELDYYVEGLSQGNAPSKGDADEITFGIARHAASPEHLMDWWLFQTPLAWKRQLIVECRYIDGKVSIEDTSWETDAGVDPCPNFDRRWPGYGDDHYVVQTWQKKIGEAPKLRAENWTGQPDVEIFADGKNLYTKIKYKGLPQFKTFAGEPTVVKKHGADPNKKNSYTAMFKIVAEGAE